ncbi:BamA/TamA family outer membrane protein [Actibacterium sp. 188UL27-1]|uniref:BamA/TamA family outer membrane protein n=1 Tax=Actibacterium sp. 188UL27-1 TaxID=2786961 RepID=UPI00195D0099|nr:BamA/TamA family outer membrane protein [Actibacterium sp. 188UL27-1]MBM7069427.1 BamA/TamA family outer membrane protein [Actibacterium sp. 188UL27-1]
MAYPVFANPQPRTFADIDVRGNQRFRDGDVIATSGLRTGRPIGEPEIIDAVEALDFTGEFREVRIFSQGTTLVIEVDETPAYSGGLTFALGYDSDAGVVGIVGLNLDDPFGPGTVIGGDLNVAEEAQTLSLAYTSDNFWRDGLSGGVRLNVENFNYDNDAFDYRIAKISPYMNLALGPRAGAELRYTFAVDEISDVDGAASAILQDEAGNRTSSGVGFSVITGSEPLTDATVAPRAAWSLRFDQDFTGLGGDTEISRSMLSFYGRAPITDNGWAVRTRVELGRVAGTGDDAPTATDRFFLGGAALRGFERGTISPRDVCVGCAADGGDVITNLGGNQYAVARTDLLVPLFPSRPGLETFVFGDVGSVWSVESGVAPSGVLEDHQDWRSSYGVGAAFRTPLGIFESYYAVDTNGERFDETQKWGLTFRAEF